MMVYVCKKKFLKLYGWFLEQAFKEIKIDNMKK
jgi:hypothetical protein